MNLAACAGLPVAPLSGTWYRAIQPQHWATALQTSQTRAFATRYNAGPLSPVPFDVLYLAQDPVVALFEVGSLLGSLYGTHLPNPASAWVVLNVQVILQTIADVTPYAAQRTIDTSAQELTGDWLGYRQRLFSAYLNQPVGLAPTQELGAAMFSVPQLEGFQTLSAKVTDKRALVIFPDKLRIGSSVDFIDKAKRRRHKIQGTQP